ncbi:hypothetical protein GQ600_20501 [Phytophthora cactorum]|nr:hypothetical protein GQ600_20501 [Phytophthora cactorum]
MGPHGQNEALYHPRLPQEPRAGLVDGYMGAKPFIYHSDLLSPAAREHASFSGVGRLQPPTLLAASSTPGVDALLTPRRLAAEPSVIFEQITAVSTPGADTPTLQLLLVAEVSSILNRSTPRVDTH